MLSAREARRKSLIVKLLPFKAAQFLVASALGTPSVKVQQMWGPPVGIAEVCKVSRLCCPFIADMASRVG